MPKRSLTTKLSQSWQDLSLKAKGLILIVLPLAILLISLGSLYTHEQQALRLENQLEQSLKNQRNIQNIHIQIIEASNAVRDYLLTADKHFLQNYYQANTTIPKVLNALSVELTDDTQRKHMQKILPLIKQSLATLGNITNAQIDKASEELIHQFLEQNNTLDALRLEFEALSLREATLAKLNQDAINRERQRNIQLTLYAALSGILGTIIGAVVFSRTIVDRVKTLRDSASNLAQGHKLQPLAHSRDEIGEMVNALEVAAITLAKSAEEAHQARVEAEEASASKSLFLSRTSHELRTPLNAILGFTQLLEDELPESKQKESVTLIKGAGEHLLNLINELLDIARIEAGTMELHFEAVNLNQVLEEACNYIAPLGTMRNIKIERAFNEHILVETDRKKLMQVILNLLSNALKYGPANSTVTLKAFKNHETATVEVKDAGAGISQAMRNRVFTPFDRLGAERSKTEGTGLGLALCKHLMKAMHGDIHIAEHESRFCLEMPLAKQAPTLGSVPSAETSQVTLALVRPHDILYVEDNPSNQALLAAIIARHKGLRLHSAASLLQAKSLLQEIKPDLILIDLNLPDGSGEQLITWIQSHEQHQHTPMMVLTADASNQTITNLAQLGIAEVLTKPINVAIFNARLKTLLG